MRQIKELQSPGVPNLRGQFPREVIRGEVEGEEGRTGGEGSRNLASEVVVGKGNKFEGGTLLEEVIRDVAGEVVVAEINGVDAPTKAGERSNSINGAGEVVSGKGEVAEVLKAEEGFADTAAKGEAVKEEVGDTVGVVGVVASDAIPVAGGGVVLVPGVEIAMGVL